MVGLEGPKVVREFCFIFSRWLKLTCKYWVLQDGEAKATTGLAGHEEEGGDSDSKEKVTERLPESFEHEIGQAVCTLIISCGQTCSTRFDLRHEDGIA